MQDLINYLDTLPPGPVKDAQVLSTLLAPCWHLFHGSSDESTFGGKLVGRIEDVRWMTPILSFIIERHGGTVNGSSRADLHTWIVNIDQSTARCDKGRFRQLEKMDSRLDVKPLAQNIAQLISELKEDSYLKWRKDGTVQVNIGKVIPDTRPQQTLIGRRKRFRNELSKILALVGWNQIRANVFSRVVEHSGNS